MTRTSKKPKRSILSNYVLQYTCQMQLRAEWLPSSPTHACPKISFKELHRIKKKSHRSGHVAELKAGRGLHLREIILFNRFGFIIRNSNTNTDRADNILQYYWRVGFETRSGHRLLHTRSTIPLDHNYNVKLMSCNLSATTLHVLQVIKFTTRTKANCSIHKLDRTAAMLVHHYSVSGKNLRLVAWAGT